jgi:four helix bundle protein
MKETTSIASLSFAFALRIIQLYRVLVENHEYVLSKQLLRSGTGIGANVEEASAGQTKRDFISKMSIASKEARETRYWLKLLEISKIVNLNYSEYLKEIDSIIRVLTKIVKTSQQGT